MKRIIVCVLLIAAMLSLFCISASAAQFEYDMDDEPNIYGELYDGVMTDDFDNSIPDTAKRFVEEYGLSPENPSSFDRLLGEEGLSAIWQTLINYILSPIKTAAVLLTVILLLSVISGLKLDNQAGATVAVQGFCSLVCCVIILSPIAALITDCANLLCSLSIFMTALIPIYAGLLIAAAKAKTALGFQTCIFFATQAVSYIGTYIVSPFSSMFTALSIAGGVSGEKRLGSLAEMLKKAAMWTMSIAMTVYMAVFSIKNIISSTVDSAGGKTARFLISSFVPIVGNSINEALSSMKGCVSVLCRSFGIYAVIIILCIIVPVLVRLIFWRAMLSICAAVSDILGTENVSVMMKAMGNAVMILSAVVICASVMYIFSVTVLSHAVSG